MKLQFALIAALAFSTSSPATAGPLQNPDAAWWGSFLKAVDGAVPDFERQAKADPEYLAADEFTRAEVLARVVERLQAEQAVIDVNETEVAISIRARLGDYSIADGGFPVDIFGQNMRLQPAGRALFFRNWDDFSIFLASVDEGRELRTRIGNRPVAAEVTLADIRPSVTRQRAYDARILSVVYFAEDGLKLAEIVAPEEKTISAEDGAAQLVAARDRILAEAGIPALGTTWEVAKSRLSEDYPIVASDQFAYPDSGKTLAYVYEDGRVITDEPHEADKPFRVFLQQADGDWRATPGFSVNMNDMMYGIDGLDTKGLGAGLACYTPSVNDRCAVLEFSPRDGGHILTRAYGVIEMERTGAPREVLEGFLGESAVIFEGFTAPLGYNLRFAHHGAESQSSGRGTKESYMVGAGAGHDGEPIYDPLKITTGVKAINREVALFAVDGSENRVPLIFVLQ